MKKPNSYMKGIVVEVREGNINVALRKLKRKVDDAGVLIELLKRQAYEKPTETRKRKKGAARARWLKKLRDQQLPKKMY
jgi:small subunit ribosomal protein S21